MARKNAPQKAASREKMDSFMKENNVKITNWTDVNSIMRDMMSIILEGTQDEEFGYSSMAIINKDTENS